MKNTYITFLFILLLVTGCKNEETNKIKTPIVKIPENNLPYRLNEEKIIENQNDKTLSLKFIIEESDTITKNHIEQFVENSMDYYIKKYDLRNSNVNNQMRLYVFTSLEKANSGMAQWIAHTTFHSKKFKEEIKIDETQLASLSEIKKDNWDLSYNERQILWKEILKIEDRAASMRLHSNVDSDAEKNYINFYNRKLSEKHLIDSSILDSITNEALKYGWSF